MPLSVTRHLSSDTLLAERDRLVLWIPVLLATGVGLYFAWPYEPPLSLPLRALFLLTCLFIVVRRRFFLRLFTIATALVALGFLAAQYRTASVVTPVFSGGKYFRGLEGRIDDIQIKEKGQKLFLTALRIDDIPTAQTPVRISVTLRKHYPELHVGNHAQLKALLFAPPGPAIPGGYDFSRGFYFERVGAVGFSPSAPVVIEQGEISGFDAWLTALRLAINERIVAPMYKENGPVAAAMMVGEQSAVSEEVNDSMRASGLYHVLSISGLHMSIAAGLLYVFMRLLLSLYPPWALRLPVKKIAAAFGLLGAFVYLLLAGHPVPAVRSFVMVACVMAAILLDRRGISMYSLAWAAALILLFQPEALLGASFQLSFAATIAILALYERYSYLLHDSLASVPRKIRLYFFGLMLTSLAASLATAPLVIYNFNRFPLWGIGANMLMVPLATFWIMPAAVLAFVAMPLGLEHWPLQWLDTGIGWMIAGSKWIAAMPHASVAVVSPSWWGIVLCIYGVLWLCLWQGAWRLLGLPLVVIGLSTVALHEPYDLLVSDDATKIAMRMEDNNWLFLRGRADSFDAQLWLKTHGKSEAFTLSDLKDKPNAPRCDEKICEATVRGYDIAVARKKDAQKELCGKDVDIVIVEDYIDDEACAAIPLVIDRRFLKHAGAVGIRFPRAGIVIDTSEELRGRRPWVPY
jgi:competence protein ComEC